MVERPTVEFLQAFADGRVERARELVSGLAPADGLQTHPVLRECVERNGGHCYRQAQLEIADLLIADEVRLFRDAVLGDEEAEVRDRLSRQEELVRVEFTAGRGLAQAIHHWKSIGVGALLLDAGADIHALTTVHEGDTPLGMQVRFGSLETVRFLLERRADPNQRPRMHMPSERMVETIQLLLDFGWDIQQGHQLLHDANHGHGQRVVNWLRFGVDPNARDDRGRTALHLLAERGGRAAIRALVEAGADLERRDQTGRTPLEIAREASSQSAARELESLGK